MILIIDNYDSFTYNLVQYVGTITNDIKIIKNNEMPIEKIKNRYFSYYHFSWSWRA